MSVNKLTILKTDFVNKSINIPIELSWDYLGLDMSIDEYENRVIDQVLGLPQDFEVDRFAHMEYDEEKTSIGYEFNFYNGGSLDNSNSWSNSYLSNGFTVNDVYYYLNNFSNSFFKLDLYDTKNETTQVNYITIILPTQQGLIMESKLNLVDVVIKKPRFELDFIGDKEGFFIYWLKKREFLNIDKFYMTAKFFDAKTGQFIKFINYNGPQSNLGNKYVFDSNNFLYYTVKLDYLNQKYIIENNEGVRVGNGTPIKWFEYVNPK